MKNLSSSHSLAILVMALAVTTLVMVPLITGAAPTADPPDGLITPTFSGLNINDATKNTLTINGNGVLSNPTVTNETDPACQNNGGLYYGDCYYPVTANGYGGVRVLSSEPGSPPWFYADTRINGKGINIFSQNGDALNVHSANPTGPYNTDFNVNTGGVNIAVYDSDGGNYVTYKGLDATDLDNLIIYSSQSQSGAEPAFPETWQSGALINMDAWNSVLTLGAKKVSLGNYVATSYNTAPVFTETMVLDNTTATPSLEIKGHLKAANGIGSYSTGTTDGTANANSAKFFTAPCPSGYKVISCGYKWPAYNNTLDMVWTYPNVDKCAYNFKNNDTVARTLTGYAVCYNDKV